VSPSIGLLLRFARHAEWEADPRAGRRRHRWRTTFDLPALGLVVGLLALAYGAGPVWAAASVNLDQWASTDLAWQNGNLNGNNSRYPEGGIVPFRVAAEGLSPGTHDIHINYDFSAGGHKAYDFLATWNVTNAQDRICAVSGGAISSMCPNMPVPSSAAFPSDAYLANGLPVAGAEGYSAAPRRLTIWGGTIESIAGPIHSGSPDGNSTGDFLVRFNATGSAVLLAWGGHLAQSAYWDKAIGGPPDGAAQVSGAPWHMRTLQLDASGNKNQDRSIQPSAIVGELPPFALAPPTPAPAPVPPPAAPAPTPVATALPAGPAPTTTPRATAPAAGPAPTPRPGGRTPPTAAPRSPAEPGRPVVTVPPTSTLVAARGADPQPRGEVLAALGVAALAGAALSLMAARGHDGRRDRRRRRSG
jgi:hypothetical protein